MSGTGEKSGADFHSAPSIDSMSVDERIAYFQKLLLEFQDKEQAIEELERRYLQARPAPDGSE